MKRGQTNTFFRLGYQIGTPDDARSNAIVGESRSRSQQLFTAVREIGPGDAGFTAAATYSSDRVGGDFRYLKLETESLKRFRITERTFVIGRLSAGTFVLEDRIAPADGEVVDVDQWSIPRGEYFHLDGRDNLRGVNDKIAGTKKLITTWELFFPWFIGENRSFLRAEWQNWYWVLYGGYGTVGFERQRWSDLGGYTPDVGVGFETSLKVRNYRFFIGGILAQALKDSGGVEARFSVKSFR